MTGQPENVQANKAYNLKRVSTALFQNAMLEYIIICALWNEMQRERAEGGTHGPQHTRAQAAHQVTHAPHRRWQSALHLLGALACGSAR